MIVISSILSGGLTTAIDNKSATTTSDKIDCQGFNSILIECLVEAIFSGNWIIEVLGSFVSDETFGNCYAPKDDGTFVQQKTPSLTANGKYIYYFRGIPDYIKIKATRITDGTITVKMQPVNL